MNHLLYDFNELELQFSNNIIYWNFTYMLAMDMLELDKVMLLQQTN